MGIARALYHAPSVLVLDEATSALDTATEKGVMEAVMALRGSKTIPVVAHRLSTVEHCDRQYRLEYGLVVGEEAPGTLTSLQRHWMVWCLSSCPVFRMREVILWRRIRTFGTETQGYPVTSFRTTNRDR